MPSSRSKTREHENYATEHSPAREKKRRNMPPVRVACAECRRLKLRCSDEFPCHNCVKKGCGAICPDGSMTTGKGNRFVIAKTEALHDKINQLSNRVRQLEDGLAISNSLNTREPHPLLSEELLSIKNPLELEKDQYGTSSTKEEEPDVNLDEFDSLTIGRRGRSAFFGQTATSWHILENEQQQYSDESEDELEPELPATSTDIHWLSHLFPFSPPLGESSENVRQTIKSCLPDAMFVREVADLFYKQACWWAAPLSRDNFYATIYPRIYEPTTMPTSDFLESHDLAVLYLLLAVGLQTDPRMPLNSPDAARYFHLGRAALTLDPPLQEHTITAVLAMCLMCYYFTFAEMEKPLWVVVGITARLCISIGIHRDSDKFNLSPEETTRRRIIMWEIYSTDIWQSFNYGRPPAFSLFHFDARMPYETTLGPSGELEMNFSLWKYRFLSQCVAVLQHQIFSPKALGYKKVLELDQKIRDFYVPPSLIVPGFGGAAIVPDERPSSDLTFQRHSVSFYKEMTLFYMHRGFFAKAMQDYPDDPCASKYYPSVLAVYNSACTVLSMMENLHALQAILTERVWFLFGHVFSCAVVFTSIAERSRMVLASSALANLEVACRFFERVTANPRVVKLLPVLRKMQERARNAFKPQAYEITQTRAAGSDKDSESTVIDFTSPSTSSYPYPTSTTERQPPLGPPRSFQTKGSAPGPVWQDYYNRHVEDSGGYWTPSYNATTQPGLPGAYSTTMATATTTTTPTTNIPQFV